jgi:hypothetical protein
MVDMSVGKKLENERHTSIWSFVQVLCTLLMPKMTSQIVESLLLRNAKKIAQFCAHLNVLKVI